MRKLEKIQKVFDGNGYEYKVGDTLTFRIDEDQYVHGEVVKSSGELYIKGTLQRQFDAEKYFTKLSNIKKYL